MAEEDDDLECGICCMPYDRCGRAPRRLGGARGSWKPSRCRHVICSACVCQLARAGWWEEVTCPYCRAVTSLRERANFLVAGVRRGSGSGRRRLVLPPIDTDLWQRVVRLEEAERQADGRKRGGSLEPEEEEEAPEEEEQAESEETAASGQRRLWSALKRLLKGGAAAEGGAGRPTQARGRRGRGRSRSVPPRRSLPNNPYDSEIIDLALTTCYMI